MLHSLNSKGTVEEEEGDVVGEDVVGEDEIRNTSVLPTALVVDLVSISMSTSTTASSTASTTASTTAVLVLGSIMPLDPLDHLVPLVLTLLVLGSLLPKETDFDLLTKHLCQIHF